MKEFSTKNNFCVFLTQADDLGRVVIPKEIRRTMRIREGDASLIWIHKTAKLLEFCVAPVISVGVSVLYVVGRGLMKGKLRTLLTRLIMQQERKQRRYYSGFLKAL